MTKVEGEYDIEAVRAEWIGKSSPVHHGRYPVEYDPIRRHCHMVEDDNPLFLDPEYAATTKWGGVIVPPVMTDYFAGTGAWPPVEDGPNIMLEVPTPGDRTINLNVNWEFLQPARIGDRLSRQTEITDVYQKPTRLDPKSVWIESKTTISNQDGEVVAIGRGTMVAHRRPEEFADELEEGGA